MSKKSYEEKLRDTKGLPIVKEVPIDMPMARKKGGNLMLIASPLQYNDIMKRVPKGKVITSVEIRDYLAKKANANFTCAMTAGIFINICANASFERKDEKIPYWRTLKSKGELNPKYPQGIEEQSFLLESEGFEIIKKGKKYFVKDFEKSLWEIK